LLDDTYVSGSRAQSAAASLGHAGARSTLIVPLGRVLRPDRVPSHAEYVAETRRQLTGGQSTGGQSTGGHRCCRCVLPQPVPAMG
jgi:hypothetical protein